MKRNIFKLSFAAIFLMALVMNFSQSKNTRSDDTSLIAKNMLAIANAEGSDPVVVCIQPPRTICHFLSDWTPIYGENYN
jgi:hypothetical protein